MVKRVLILVVLLLGVAGALWGCGCGASTDGADTSTTTTSTTTSSDSTTTNTGTTTTTSGGVTTTTTSSTTTTTAYIAPGWARYQVDTSGNVNEQTSIALNSAGAPYVSYYSRYLYSASRESGVWRTELVDDSNYAATGQYSSIVIANDGYPHVSYSDLGALKYAYRTVSGWTWEAVDSVDIVHNSIVLNSSNQPYIAYYDANNKVLKVAEKTSGSWNRVTVDNSSSDVGQFCAIALENGSNYPHISYYDFTNGDLKYVYKNALGWQIPVTVDSSGNVGSHSHIALDGSNRPHISYYDQTNGNLKYVYYNGSSWTTPQTVDSVNDVGKYTAIAINSSGYPIITYFDSTNLSLRYASFDGSTWHPMLVAANAGYFSSLVLDGSNKAHVSYVDSSAGYLMYAGEL